MHGGQTMTGRLRRVLVRRPEKSFGVDDPTLWHYASQPDPLRAGGEHDRLVSLLEREGVEVVRHDAPLPGLADSIFVFDPALVTNAGAVRLRMGKGLRLGEEQAICSKLESVGIPTIGAIEPPGTVEGGDLLWLDPSTLAAGRGFRTNRSGIEQLQAILRPLGIRVLSVDLPCWEGRQACLHLLSLISLIDRDLAVVFERLLPVPLWEELEARGIQVVEVDGKEFTTLGVNVLCIEPRRCLLLDVNHKTRRSLEAAGCTVLTYTGSEISLKAEGGPTCLTLPLLREPAGD